jgi:hypothetical protein
MVGLWSLRSRRLPDQLDIIKAESAIRGHERQALDPALRYQKSIEGIPMVLGEIPD